MEQHHIIKRQVLDIGLESDVGSFLFQGELRDMYYAEIVPVLEQCCHAIDDSSEIYKINRLEIDLGTIDQNNLAEDFKSKVLEHFYEELSRAVRDMPSKEEIKLRDNLATESGAYPGATDEDSTIHYISSTEESELELLSHFIKTGRLPWWTRKEETVDLIAAMDKQLKGADSQFIELLKDVTASPAALKRLIYQFSSQQLERIVEILAKINQEAISNSFNRILERLKELPILKDSPAVIHKDVWQSIFSGLAADPKAFSNKEGIEELAIRHLPKQYRFELAKKKKTKKELEFAKRSLDVEKGTSPEEESALFETGEKEGEFALAFASKESQLTRLFKEISALVGDIETKNIPVDKEAELLKSTGESLFELLNIFTSIKEQQTTIKQVINGKEPAKQQIKHQLISLVTIIREKLLLLSKNIRFIKREEEHIFAEIIRDNDNKTYLDNIQMLVDDLIDSRLASTKKKSFVFDLSSKGIDQVIPVRTTSDSSDDDKPIDRIDVDVEAQEIDKPRPKKHSDLFAESEELYINNAGLVLFWPYLGRFFKSVGNLEENQFVNKAKQEHTVLLLQYLVQGYQGFHEYDLSLNKILCGLDPNDPVPTVVQLEDKETEETDTLLSTLIQHWSVLKNMSSDGFRKMFLNREGMISIRDGNYVLRVEEQTYDVLIDKMPWQITTVKLPWMENLIFVEWRL